MTPKPAQNRNIFNQQSQRPLLFRPALAGLALLSLISAHAVAQDSVHYQIEVVSEWSALTHPVNFPSNPHIAGIIGATHTEAINIWMPEGIATHGIEVMAETGARTQFETEIENLIATGNEVDRFRFIGGLTTSPSVRISNQTILADFPVISLVGMIAPSPDWFIGVHDINLREDGIWAREIVIELDPYDSGTDSGVSYGSSNADITPHIPIANLADVFPFTGTPRFGTITFTLMTTAACSRADIAEPYEQLNFFDVSAFLASFAALDPIADINNDGEFNFFDVSAFLTVFSAGCP